MRGAWLFLLAPLLAAAPGVAAAAAWTVAPEQSRIDFGYTRNGQPDAGHFARFRGSGDFDRDRPETARLTLQIDSASIDLGAPLVSAFATSAEWFDSANYPEVVYRLVRLTPVSGDTYRALGDLTIRGKTEPIETEITLAINDGEAHAAGTLKVDRTDYLLGVGPSALFITIGHEVAVRFDLTAHPTQ